MRDGKRAVEPGRWPKRNASLIRVRGYRSLDNSLRVDRAPHPNPLRASLARLDPARAGRGRGKQSALQEFTRLIQRAKFQPGLCKSFARAFFAVHHGEDQDDLAAG